MNKPPTHKCICGWVGHLEETGCFSAEEMIDLKRQMYKLAFLLKRRVRLRNLKEWVEEGNRLCPDCGGRFVFTIGKRYDSFKDKILKCVNDKIIFENGKR
jgi:hypothetical protein